MNTSVTALPGVLLLIGMTLSAYGQVQSTAADSSPPAQHRNPEYVAPATEPTLTQRDGQLADTDTQASRHRVGWFRRLLVRFRNPDNLYATPVLYGSPYSPRPVSTTDDSSGPFRNQLYSTGQPGLDPLRTKWLLIRSIAGKEPDHQ